MEHFTPTGIKRILPTIAAEAAQGYSQWPFKGMPVSCRLLARLTPTPAEDQAYQIILTKPGQIILKVTFADRAATNRSIIAKRI